eukprot:gene16281-15228_t
MVCNLKSSATLYPAIDYPTTAATNPTTVTPPINRMPGTMQPSTAIAAPSHSTSPTAWATLLKAADVSSLAAGQYFPAAPTTTATGTATTTSTTTPLPPRKRKMEQAMTTATPSPASRPLETHKHAASSSNYQPLTSPRPTFTTIQAHQPRSARPAESNCTAVRAAGAPAIASRYAGHGDGADESGTEIRARMSTHNNQKDETEQVRMAWPKTLAKKIKISTHEHALAGEGEGGGSKGAAASAFSTAAAAAAVAALTPSSSSSSSSPPAEGVSALSAATNMHTSSSPVPTFPTIIAASADTCTGGSNATGNVVVGVGGIDTMMARITNHRSSIGAHDVDNNNQKEEIDEKDVETNSRNYSKRLRTLPAATETNAHAHVHANAAAASSSSLQTFLAAGSRVSFRAVEAKLDDAIAAADAAAATMREAVFATVKQSIAQQQAAAATASTPAMDVTDDCRMQITKVAEAVARGTALKAAKAAVGAVRTEAQDLAQRVAAHNFQRVTALQQALQVLTSTTTTATTTAAAPSCASSSLPPATLAQSLKQEEGASDMTVDDAAAAAAAPTPPPTLMAGGGMAALLAQHGGGASGAYPSGGLSGASSNASSTSTSPNIDMGLAQSPLGDTNSVTAFLLAQAATSAACTAVGVGVGAGVPPAVAAAAASAVAAAAARPTQQNTQHMQQQQQPPYPVERTTSSQDTAADMLGDADLYKTMTPEMLQAPPTEWKTVWRSIAPQLTGAQQKRSKVLRRRALSCLYARRSRQKRAAAMNALLSTNTVLATENMYLQQKREVAPGTTTATAAAHAMVVQQQPPQQQHRNAVAFVN